MTRIALIVTGGCEERAIGASLATVFPQATFEVRPRRDGFTSARVDEASPTTPLSVVRKLAASIVAEVAPGRRGARVDFVVAIEDLELVNADQPAAVASHFARAVQDHVGQHDWSAMASRARAESSLREKCSFHLLAPMVEAYFFGEAKALGRAGVPSTAHVQRNAGDLESFETSDAAYAASPEAALVSTPRRHPKAYLQYLTSLPGGTPYREREGGAAALATLEWGEVLAPRAEVRLARSLFDDIADMLGVVSPFPGDIHAATARRPGATLRNI